MTDRPQPGRSSFQAFSLPDHVPGQPFETVDLASLERFRIFPHNIADHETLLREGVALTFSPWLEPRAPPAAPIGDAVP